MSSLKHIFQDIKKSQQKNFAYLALKNIIMRMIKWYHKKYIKIEEDFRDLMKKIEIKVML